ncbi:hypothetical protein Tco_0164413, partial [Tanacetum coccineum]
ARKRVRALPSGRLASRYPPDHSSSDHFSSDDSSSDSPSDSSSVTISAGPSRKRCRSLATLVPLATPTPEALSPVRADLLPSRNRIRDIDDDAAAAETAAALEASIGIEANVRVEVGIGIEREDEVEEEAESRDKGTIEIGVDRVSDIKSAQREQGRRMLAASEQRAGGVEANSRDENGNDNGNGDCLGGGNRNRNPNVNVGGVVPVTRECTYQDFMKCQPLNFKGTEGVIGLTRWFEKMEIWNSHKRIVGTDVAYAMSWKALMKLMTKVYCPRNEIQKMETELWNLAVMGNDLNAYT